MLCSFDSPRCTNHQESRRHLADRVLEPSHAAFARPERRDRHFVDLYFERFYPYWPFVHRVSFNVSRETPLLTQSMMDIGLWASGEQSAQRATLDLHRTLDLANHQQREVWDASIAEDAGSTCSWPIATYQAILLHVMFAIMRQGGSSVGFDLKLALPPADSQLLDSLVGSCKQLGMFYYPNIVAQHLPVSVTEIAWVGIEEVKRFNLTLYKVHKMLSRWEPGAGLAEGDTVPEASGRGLAAIDLQFPMPTNNRLWNAANKNGCLRPNMWAISRWKTPRKTNGSPTRQNLLHYWPST
ncbi:uncharacterized protein KD926_010290 [Aspergillus affinis]|uniref:uncharacterized protein n=1 Tax=Aspergillus affinis TaxID=1070780 RepID=UPI0022FE852B|nr:uncharacterized protein KD926_010290 [Aspergillus affinis]KAI9044967.1 hypothetical protein KD926_010290 [Aspergillus affinis]